MKRRILAMSTTGLESALTTAGVLGIAVRRTTTSRSDNYVTSGSMISVVSCSSYLAKGFKNIKSKACLQELQKLREQNGALLEELEESRHTNGILKRQVCQLLFKKGTSGI